MVAHFNAILILRSKENQSLHTRRNQTTTLYGKFCSTCNSVGQFYIINFANFLTLQMRESILLNLSYYFVLGNPVFSDALF